MTDDNELVWLVGEFVHAATWPGSQAVVEAHPELLDGKAETILAKRAASARQQGDHDTAARLDLHRRLLERCRQIGVEAAFDERAEAGAGAPLGLEGVSLEQAERAAQMLFGFVEGDLAEARRLAEEHPQVSSWMERHAAR